MAREIANQLIAAAHVDGDGSSFARGGFGTITRIGLGQYQFTADGVQREVFAAGDIVINVSVRAVLTVAISETLFPGGPLQIDILSADGKNLTDAPFDIVVMNAGLLGN